MSNESLESLIQLARTKKLPQTLLLIGHEQQALTIAQQLIRISFCSAEQVPCHNCPSCLWMEQKIHPDVELITSDSDASSIKIEQIRALQQEIYQTPKISQYRFVIIHPLEQLNINASNALLKILEEPPKHVIFILIATHNLIIPTLLSRCQKYYISTGDDGGKHYYSLALSYPKDSSRGLLFTNRSQLILDLIAVTQGKLDVCSAAVQWQKYDLNDFLWFLYLLLATVIQNISQDTPSPSDELDLLTQILKEKYFQPMHLFSQLDKIVESMLIIKKKVSLNSALVIESILLGFYEDSHVYDKCSN